ESQARPSLQPPRQMIGDPPINAAANGEFGPQASNARATRPGSITPNRFAGRPSSDAFLRSAATDSSGDSADWRARASAPSPQATSTVEPRATASNDRPETRPNAIGADSASGLTPASGATTRS